jgi:hypothetical protein
MTQRVYRRERGRAFTLVELLFASFVSTLVVLGIVAVFVTHARAYHDQKLLREMQQNARFAIDSIARDLRMAGYGLNVPVAELTQWISWGPSLTDNPLIVQGATAADPDTLTVAGAFEPAPATLGTAATNGTTTLKLASGGSAFNTGNKSVIYVGRRETAKVVGASGNTLTITTDPSTSKGLRFGHAVGAPVELVQVVSYSVDSAGGLFDGMPYLLREDHAEPAASGWQNMLAGHIENLQVAAASYGFTVSVTARTSDDMSVYVDPDHGDGYKRMTATTRTIPRNEVAVMVRN